MKTEELHQSLLKLESNLTDLQTARDQVIGLAGLNAEIQQSSLDLLKELKNINSNLNNNEDGFIRTVFESIKGFTFSVSETVNKLNELKIIIGSIVDITITDLNKPIEEILSNVTELNRKLDDNKVFLLELKENICSLTDVLKFEMSSLESNLKLEFEKIVFELTTQNNNVLDKISLIAAEVNKSQLILSKLELTVIDISVKIDKLVSLVQLFKSEIDDKLSFLSKSTSELNLKIEDQSITIKDIYSELSTIREVQKQINENIQFSNKQLKKRIDIQTVIMIIGFIALILLFLTK